MSREEVLVQNAVSMDKAHMPHNCLIIVYPPVKMSSVCCVCPDEDGTMVPF
jgi:hypothetical protein